MHVHTERRGVGALAATIALVTVVLPSALAAQTLPTGWAVASVGSPSLPGAATFANSRFTVSGAGAGVLGQSDQFTFAYRSLTGDGSLIARGVSLQGGSSTTRVGLMLRESLAANARHAFLGVSGVGRSQLLYRSTTSGSTFGLTTRAAAAWVKLERRSSTVTASQSVDGVTWTSIGSATIGFSSTVYVGLVVTSGNVSALTTAVLSNVSSGTSTSHPANQPPTVSLTTPTNGATFAAPATIALAANAADPDGTVLRVDFYAGATLLGSDAAGPYVFTWSNVAAGSYAITAVARDTAGASATSVVSNVTVGSNQAPTVSLSAPSSGATFSAPALITLSATASDPDGSIARVQFYSGTTLVATDTASPYTFAWTSVPAGQYSITAVAVDNAGGMTTSGARTVSVTSLSMPSSAVWVPSSNNSTAVDRYVVEIFPSGADTAVANPVATQDVGKPPVVSGECRADVGQTVAALAPGTYVATVTAFGSGGQSQSAPSPPFTR